jgi:hypothetical protein
MAASLRDKILIGAALGLALASAGTFGYFALGHHSAAVPPVELASAPYVATAPDAPPVKTETWGLPVSQTRGREWIYDTFTPPQIFYNARSKQFTVKPPSNLLDEEPQEAFGLELIGVHPEPFRLQLIGYVGGDGKWLGTFQNVTTGQVFLAGTGWHDEKLGVRITSFNVSRQPVRIGENTETKLRIATARVRDEKARRNVTLTHRERVFTGTVFAFVAAAGESDAREVRAGDVFKLGEASYRIEKISTTPPTVDVTKESPGLAQPDRRVLLPREPEDSDHSDGTAP